MDKNWTIEHTKQLFALAATAKKDGKGLNWAFSRMAESTGRSCNSVRNYYYSQLKTFELVPTLAGDLGINLVRDKRDGFTPFKKDETERLVRTVLVGKAAGNSVRSLIAELSGGDKRTALRLQNKYRSMLVHHRADLLGIMNELRASGVPYFDPYRKRIVDKDFAEDNISKLTEYITHLNEDEAEGFLSLIKKFTV